MVGFAFFMFEGIGCMLPVMREVERPEIFPKQVIGALFTLCLIYISFSSLCFYSWGSDLNEVVVTEMLPADNKFVEIMKLLFCLNLMISYPITVVPTYNALEALMGKKEKNTEDDELSDKLNVEGNSGESRALYWAINLMRSVVLASTILIVLLVYSYLDRFIAVAGAIFGMTNVLLLPSLAHLKLMAKNKCQKAVNYFTITFSVFIIVFLPYTILS